MAKGYKDFTVWQKSMDLVIEVYKIVKLLPNYETYALSDQMRRAVVSIPSNFAEGQGRYSTLEYIHFLNIARGSCFELDTQLQICVRLGYVKESDVEKSVGLCEEVGKMLSTLIGKLRKQLEE